MYFFRIYLVINSVYLLLPPFHFFGLSGFERLMKNSFFPPDIEVYKPLGVTCRHVLKSESLKPGKLERDSHSFVLRRLSGKFFEKKEQIQIQLLNAQGKALG